VFLVLLQAGGAQIEDPRAVSLVADLLQLDAAALGDALTQQTRELRGEVITTPLDVSQAADSRDSLAMGLYSSLFKWVIDKINRSLKGPETFHYVGVLDIFGFENFETNRLEQFNINYANEKLQQCVWRVSFPPFFPPFCRVNCVTHPMRPAGTLTGTSSRSSSSSTSARA
jgi:myosin X